MGLENNERFELLLTGVTVDGNRGHVSSEWSYQGEVVDFGGEDEGPDEWIFSEGQWWNNPELSDGSC